MNDPFDLQLLMAETTKFYRTTGGVLAMRSEDQDYPEVFLYRSFPYSHLEKYISVRDPKGTEIGMLETLDRLDPASLQAVRTELKLRYLTPRVTYIDKIEQKPGMWLWHVQTDKGAVRLAMRNLHEHMQSPAPGRILLTDLDGNRVEIADYRALDPQSRRLLENVM